MNAVLLVALALARVPLILQPQEHVSDIAWPTHGIVAVPQAWIQPTDTMQITEDGQPFSAQIEIVARWPDNSPKWIHAHGAYRYRAGKPARYEFNRLREPAPAMPASPLKVTDEPGGVTVDTGAVKVFIARPFAGITWAEQDGKKLIDGAGGPSLIDARGLEWRADADTKAEVIVEQQGPAQVTVKASGWYQTAQLRVEPFCRFVTRITACANSNIVRIDHATVFADDMRKHALAELSFKFALPSASGYASGPIQGSLAKEDASAFLAQLASKRLLHLTQPAERGQLQLAGQHERSAGWFAARGSAGVVTMLTKDFWQKCPKEIQISRDALTYFAWPKHGELQEPDPAALRLEGLYKFQCFLSGKLLDSRLPSDYFTALELQGDTTECKATYARAANMSGVTIHNEFALAIGTGPHQRTRDDWDRLQKLYAQDPIARPTPTALAASGALGPVTPAGGNFAALDRVARDGMLGFARSIERYDDYGWSIYGNLHHEELMNPGAAGIPQGRPSLHRVWNNNHYQHVSTSWRLFALDGDPRLLQFARIASDNYASIGQVRYDALRGYMTGAGERRAGSEVKWHTPGAFWHCKSFVPWGCRDYGMDSSDADSALAGHWPDPSGLLLAWLMDANRWAKDGYDLWLENVKFPNGGSRREVNVSLVHAITAYEYQPSPELLASIKAMATGLRGVPLVQQHPGPLFEPTWLSRYYELFPDDKQFNDFIITSADTVGVSIAGIWSMALSATAYRITGDQKYLTRHAGTLARAARQTFQDPHADKRWDQYGFAPGPNRDRHFMLQWHRFSAALRDAGLTSLPAPNEPGTYFCGSSGWNSPQDVLARGTKVLVWRDAGASPPESTALNVQVASISGGDPHPTSLKVVSPGGKEALDVPRLAATEGKAFTRVERPSSWEVAAQILPWDAKESGLYQVLMGSSQIGIFQPLTSMPECQVLRRSATGNPRSPALLMVKLTRGYLAALTHRKIDLNFQAAGDRDGSYVSIVAKNGQYVADRYLRAGETMTVSLNQPGGDAGPWLLDAFSDVSGFLRLNITADVDEPLLYGSQLEHVELIRQKLGR